MDGLRGVWHGGPFSTDKRYRFYPKQMKFGTDPVAMDRFLIDVIDDKRKAGRRDLCLGARHEVLRPHARRLAGQSECEPLHSRDRGTSSTRRALGLGVYDMARIQHTELTV